MRIIGGKARGRRLQVPKSGVRPTPDRVREALCSMLGPEIPDANILDLFAGSGAFGLECLSRGAQAVTLVEKNAKHIRVLRDNIDKAQVGSSDHHAYASCTSTATTRQYKDQIRYCVS